MIRSLLTVLLCVLAIPLFAGHKEIYKGNIVHEKELKDLPLGPNAIVIKDTAGQEALVVFYRQAGKNQQVGFAVARSVNPQTGQLNWDRKPYTLGTNIIKSGGFSPVPVLTNDKLYLFGRNRTHGDGRHLIYNYFDNLDDLIAQATRQSVERHFSELHVKLHHKFDHLSASVISDANGNDNILLAYYPRRHHNDKPLPISTMRCTEQSSSQLTCQHVPVDSTNNKYPPQLVLGISGDEHAWMFLGDPRNGKLTGYRYDLSANQWTAIHPQNAPTLPMLPMSVITTDQDLVIYFKGYRKKVAGIYNTRVSMSSFMNNDAFTLSNTTRVRENDDEDETNEGVKAIAYQDHVYLFYNRIFPTQEICTGNPKPDRRNCHLVRTHADTLSYLIEDM